MAKSHRVKIKSYRADNGRFAEKGFKEEIASCDQSITFCGVGYHHQNGIIERFQQTLTEGSRVNLLHAKRYWPRKSHLFYGPSLLKIWRLV